MLVEDLFALISIVVLSIVVMGLAFTAYGQRLKFKERKLELEAGQAAADRTAGSGELIARLEKRVRVLERLATERGPDVAAQIEALRDARLLADLSSTGVNVK